MAVPAAQDINSIVVPTPFSQYTTLNTRVLAAFVQSGILQHSPILEAFLAEPSGGSVLTRPSWGDLVDADVPRISDATAYPFYSTTYGTGLNALSPSKVKAFSEAAVRLNRNQSWSSQTLLGQLAGADPFSRIGDRVAAYWARHLQNTVLALLAGVFADNDAAPTGQDTHSAGDLTFDVSTLNAGVFLNGLTNFTAEGFMDALQTAGDASSQFTTIAVHSAVRNRMRKNNLIDFKQDSVTGAQLDYFQDLRIIVDDGMPVTSNVYDSYIFTPGSLEFADNLSGENVGTEVVRRVEAGNGAGALELWNRVQWCIHPRGHAFIGTGFASGGPDNTAGTAPLNAAASWSRHAPERKQIGLARFRTREA